MNSTPSSATKRRTSSELENTVVRSFVRSAVGPA
jgi:hypothetical protein